MFTVMNYITERFSAKLITKVETHVCLGGRKVH